jgi:UDP-N-acetylglucosamine transferase subunit ALG13
MATTSLVPPEAALVVVSVGTDHHPFDRLVAWMDGWAGEHPTVAVVVQRGSSPPTAHASSHQLIAHRQLCQLFSSATVVVCHGGPSTVMDVRAAGRLPIVVPRDPALGEHIDDHQLRFSDHLARHLLGHLARDRSQLVAALDDALADPSGYRVPVVDAAIPGVVAFGLVADDLVGTTTPVSRPTNLARPELSPS